MRCAIPLLEPLSDSELRVLGLPADHPPDYFVSRDKIRTRLRNVCLKLGVHSRADAVTRAGELGLLARTSLRRYFTRTAVARHAQRPDTGVRST
jgi:hypothetical protein